MYRLRCLPPAAPLFPLVMACKTLSCSAMHLCTPTLPCEEIQDPFDLRKHTKAEVRHLVKQIPGYYSGKAQPVHLTVLGTGGNELSPSFILKCHSRCYRFNLGEGFMRMVTSHQFHVSKNPLSLFTRAHWDTCGGAGQMYHLQEEHYENQEYLGPERMQEFMSYVQRYTGNFTWVRPETEESPDVAGVELFKDKNVTISMIPVDVEGDAGTVLAYACKLCDAPGKFFPDKAAALGIPSGPAYKFLAEGFSVITEQGEFVRPSQVQAEGRKGPTFLVVDCPTKSHSDSLTSNYCLQPEYYAKHGHKVALVVHITPLDVLQSKSYCQWMAGFGSDTQHLFLHPTLCPGEVGWIPSIKIYMALHLINPNVYLFPCLPTSNILDKSSLKISDQLSKD